MATALKAVLQPGSSAVPCSFQEALKLGWRLVGEETKLVGRFRCGTAILEHNGRRVSVPYFAHCDGYQFGVVKVLA